MFPTFLLPVVGISQTGWYDGGMKIKTSVTISQELLSAIDEFLTEGQNRSRFLEDAAWEYIVRKRRTLENEQDLEIINQHADYLNSAVMDALSDQADL